MPGPEDDLELLLDAAATAGEIAAHFFRNDPEIWDKGTDDPVTEADLAIDTMLRERLLGARPGYGWLSEETEDDAAARLGAEHVFICDPIDGTRSFIAGERSFAHSLAVTRRGQVTAAVVFLPMRDKLYGAALGSGATLNGAALRVTATPSLEQATLLTTRPNLQAKHWPRGVPAFNRAYRPSLAYRMALVGEGRFDAMLTFRQTWEWDIAAGALIIAEAGGTVSTATGEPLRFNGADATVDGVLAGNRHVHGDVLTRRGASA